MRERSRWNRRSCFNRYGKAKYCYATEGEALQAALRLERKRTKIYRAYFCSFHQAWHVGGQRGARKKILSRRMIQNRITKELGERVAWNMARENSGAPETRSRVIVQRAQSKKKRLNF